MHTELWLKLLGAGGAVGLLLALQKIWVTLFGSFLQRSEHLEQVKANEFTRLKDVLAILRSEVEQLKKTEKELLLRTIDAETRAARLELELERMRLIQEQLELKVQHLNAQLKECSIETPPE